MKDAHMLQEGISSRHHALKTLAFTRIQSAMVWVDTQKDCEISLSSLDMAWEWLQQIKSALFSLEAYELKGGGLSHNVQDNQKLFDAFQALLVEFGAFEKRSLLKCQGMKSNREKLSLYKSYQGHKPLFTQST